MFSGENTLSRTSDHTLGHTPSSTAHLSTFVNVPKLYVLCDYLVKIAVQNDTAVCHLSVQTRAFTLCHLSKHCYEAS